MNITEYANDRGVQPQTVAKYIRQHPDINKHVRTNINGTRTLSDEAIRLLDLKYPPEHKPQYVPLQQYKEALETINRQAFQIINLQQQLEAERERTWWDKLWRR